MRIDITDNKKTRFTRMCIAEAILDLLKDTEYEKLRVSHIIKRAGVARMTFYKYYSGPYDALTDYLSIIVAEYITQSGREQTRQTYLQYEHILYSLNFFDQYADFFLTLWKKNLYSIMIDGVNQFLSEHIQTRVSLSIYELYFYAGGLLNTFLKWESQGKPEPAEKIAKKITDLYTHYERLIP